MSPQAQCSSDVEANLLCHASSWALANGRSLDVTRQVSSPELPAMDPAFMVAHFRSCSCRTPPWRDGLCRITLNTSRANAVQTQPMAMCPTCPCKIMQSDSVHCANSVQSQPMASVQCASAMQSQPMPRQCQ